MGSNASSSKSSPKLSTETAALLINAFPLTPQPQPNASSEQDTQQTDLFNSALAMMLNAFQLSDAGRVYLEKELIKFLEIVRRENILPDESFIVGICLLNRILENNPKIFKRFYRNEVYQDGSQATDSRYTNVKAEGAYRLCVIAIMMGSKFHDDIPFNNKSWGLVSNRELKAITSNERIFLEVLKFNVHVTPEEFDVMKSNLTPSSAPKNGV